MQQELVAMFGKLHIIALMVSAILVGCQQKDTQEISVSSATTKQSERVVNSGRLEQRPASDLLKHSLKLTYPEDLSFTPNFLGDDGVVYGYGFRDNKQNEPILMALDTETNIYEIIKESKSDGGVVTIGVYYADKDYVFFHEYSYDKGVATNLLWNKVTKNIVEISNNENIPPLHFTDAKRLGDWLYFNTCDATGNYPTYGYQLINGELKVIEERNSGFTTVANGSLYYLLIDNEQLTTDIVTFNPDTGKKTVVSSLQGNNGYFSGLYSNGKDFIIGEQTQNSLNIRHGSLERMSDFIQTDTVELGVYAKDHFTYIGAPRNDDGVRMHNYLYDVSNNIEYLYDDNVLYLSKSGIFWVEYLKDEADIAAGSVFTRENSVMRYLKFD